MPLNVVSKEPLVFSRVTVRSEIDGVTLELVAFVNTWVDVPAITIWRPARGPRRRRSSWLLLPPSVVVERQHAGAVERRCRACRRT